MDNQELLYHYFSNSLTSEQEILFQNLLETDAKFKAQFEFEKDLKEAVKSHETDNLKAKLQEVESGINSKQKKSIFNYSNLAIAASIAVLIGWFGYSTFFSTNYTSLYEDNYNEYPNTVFTITRSEDQNSLEREAFVAYEAKNYQTALNTFEVLSEESPKDYIRFYKAQSYLGLEDNEKAKTLFKQITKEHQNFVAESTWYLALIAIKEKDKTQARTYLENLVVNYDYNKDKAQELLEALN
ncbi:tetratricopeptide repeat protein [Mesonia sp. MT50]|uniref:Tetratricopeptide repeat protein n=1 Tax=Mesonia profundi TaxID=3070998 RepID=A0ABU1A288_9FLAO|nr:tetratricopeptide repeat protein [Mesonia profundi]MDQ7917376.1 tetratricopeptide repeat protein [Mesonia profundi]